MGGSGKRTLVFFATGTACAFLAAGPRRAVGDGEAAMWIRSAAISPDGARVAFSYRGDIWVAPTAAGRAAAKPVTTHVGHERSPVWSRDGTRIAFASDRFGNFDVFVASADGGPAHRLTFHSAHDTPSCFTPDDKEVVFASTRADAPESMVASTWLPELYAVPLSGGRPRMLLTTPADRVQYAKDGSAALYQDRKAYENEWRKHHTSSAARDVWLWRPAAGTHTKLTSFAGEDRNPVWAPDGRSFLWLSEQGGSFNVWRRAVEGTGPGEQVTRHAGSPVRFLSAADDGTICYTFGGGVWVKAPADAEPRRLDIAAPADDRTNAVLVETKSDGATEMAPSPDGTEVALVVRGDVFVASAKHGTTRRITSTPEMERSVSWAPDGKSLWYAGERGGSWNLFRTSVVREGEDHLLHATELREESMLATPAEEFQPLVAPDGKSVAFVQDRDAIAVLDVATRQTRVLVPAERNYSYADGDLRFAWSPDSRFLATYFVPRNRWIGDVGIVDVATGTIENVTESGYEEDAPQWTADGRALVFQSDRLGRRAHGSWGADGDLFAFDLTRDSAIRAKLSKEDLELAKKAEEKAAEPAKKAAEDAAKKAAEEAAKAGAAPPAAPKEEPPKPVEIEWERRDRRIRRLTVRSAPLGGWAVAPDGETVVYWAQVENSWDLWAARPRGGDERKIVQVGAEEPGDVVFAKDGKSVFVRTSEGGVAKVALGGTDGEGELSGTREDVRYAAELIVDLARERAAIFEHAWRQAAVKFYEPGLHGVDWKALRAEHVRFLPSITNGWDFAELLSEMLGELNASHTGAGHRPEPRPDAAQTAALGLLFDPAWRGDGLRVSEVLPQGPFDRASSKIRAGAIVTAIDGAPLPPTIDPAALLDRKAGRHVVVTATATDGTQVTERVRAIAVEEEAALAHRRWVQRAEDAVAQASGGRVGYVHVAGMDEESFRWLYKDSLGKHADCDALLVDTRWNGGGWLHDDLVRFLGGREYLRIVPRGKARGRMGSEPLFRWTRPVAVLMNEGNYSDAHVFPYAFRALGIGRLIGAPVAGTGTAVWWERQVDPSIVFGIPQVGLETPDGRYLENQELAPDVLVLPDPADLAKGIDRQLLTGVEELLKEADARRPR